MRIVARETGLKPDLLRAWERRYGAIRPGRSKGRRRLYSRDDIRRLTLLQRAVGAGHRIGDIAYLTEPELKQLVKEPETAASSVRGREDSVEPFLNNYLDACFLALVRMDANGLAIELEKAAVSLGYVALIDRLVIPLLGKVGDLWERGTLRVYQEHLASSVVRSFLGRLLLGAHADETAPLFVAATPAGQLHELGALAAAIAAVSEGWAVAYLGPNLPAEEILAAVQSQSARVLALSLVYPGDDPRLSQELEMIGRHLPEETQLLVGGRAGAGYLGVIEKIGGRYLPGMPELRQELRALRAKPVEGTTTEP